MLLRRRFFRSLITDHLRFAPLRPSLFRRLTALRLNRFNRSTPQPLNRVNPLGLSPLRHIEPRTSNIKHGFTLVELLVVISIIIILMGLLFPAFKGAQDQAKRAQAKNDLTQIVTAVNAFYTEYGKYPTSATVDASAKYGTGNSNTNDKLFNELRGKSVTLNTRQIVFITPPDAKDQTNSRGGIQSSTGRWFDPWGATYAVALDANYDNLITNPYGNNTGAGPSPISQGVIAWSVGKNGALGGGARASSSFVDESGIAGQYKDSSDVISWQ